MLDAATGHDANIGTKSRTAQVGEHSAAEQGFFSTIKTLERSGSGSSGELVAALTSLAGCYVLRGAFGDAEPLLTRALTISEQNADAEQSDIAILLNDLARICLKQNAYTLAEPLLTRLVAIKQSKGENHPEVATVLASLAAVRQALGQHESAEQLWRRVLDIRERTLAPNHISVASALEHLAEACEARGKLGEALQLYQRAQTIRQLTLGNNHPSVQISRDRIADLQLQASEVFGGAAPEPSAPVSTPDGFRLRFPSEQRMISPAPFVAPTPFVPPTPFVAPTPEPPRSSEEKQVTRNVSVEPPQSLLVIPPPRDPRAIESAKVEDAAAEAGMAPYHGILLSIANELGDTYEEGESQSYQERDIPAWVSAFMVRHKRNLALAGAVIVAVVVGAWAWDAKTGKQTTGLSAELQPTMAFAAAPAAAGAARPTANDSQPSNVSRATVSAAPARGKAQPVPESGKKGSDQKEIKVAIPKLSAKTMLNVDSAVSAAAAGTRNLSESIGPDVGALATLSERSSFENGELSAARAHRALLIGSLPAPTLPNYSSGAEGEVVVSFAVDIQGRPMLSTFAVVRSPDPMLTSAVRKVIPSLRFEPAQTAGPDPRRVVDTVQVVYRFAQHVKQ
ncbi:MAG: Tfp pilus assembly protein PilF [Gemmatimonadales bacterium]|jgi:tetratricopeptide (TPR) repeat protein|nr:Tfp pilus assembly protein PilF [Gemmatimonadales bacterium]